MRPSLASCEMGPGMDREERPERVVISWVGTTSWLRVPCSTLDELVMMRMGILVRVDLLPLGLASLGQRDVGCYERPTS